MERCLNDVVVSTKVQSHIPKDLFFSILSKLPVKSLKRFECVCKSWSLLFDNPNFMNAYRKNFLTYYEQDTSVLLHKTIDAPFDGYYVDQKFELYSVSNENNNNNLVKLDWPNVILDGLPGYDSGFDILGPSTSVQGTLCLICSYLQNTVLWNPSTNQFKLIPLSPFHSLSYFSVGDISVLYRLFGYDPIKADHKFMRHITLPPKSDYDVGFFTRQDFDFDSFLKNQHDFDDMGFMWEIYSLRTNSWTKLDLDMDDLARSECGQLYMDGLSHWLCRSLKHDRTYLVSFDWNNEVFRTTTPLPSYMNDGYHCVLRPGDLLLLNGSIGLITYNDPGKFNISILGELGVKESWTKIFTVGFSPCFDYPMGAGKKGNILFMKKDGELAWLNLNTQMIEDLGVKMERWFCKMVVHKENLLPLEGEII